VSKQFFFNAKHIPTFFSNSDKDFYSGNNNVSQVTSVEMFIKLALTLFFKRQQHRKLSWLDKDSEKIKANLMNFSIERVL
jgi:hypothetical protein